MFRIDVFIGIHENTIETCNISISINYKIYLARSILHYSKYHKYQNWNAVKSILKPFVHINKWNDITEEKFIFLYWYNLVHHILSLMEPEWMKAIGLHSLINSNELYKSLYNNLKFHL